MRNLLLLLLLANVLYFLYEHFVVKPDMTGIAVVRETQLGPELQLADPNDPEPAPPVDAEDDPTGTAGLRTELEAVVGRSCVTIGPFREETQANAALDEFESGGLNGAVRAMQGEVFVGHWVQIRNIETRAAANRMLVTLSEAGLDEAYIVETEDEGIKISLGLFSELSGAERIELRADALELPAEITERMREQEVYFVDFGLPPGRGAGSMIERYGEERVLLRDAATCPGGAG